MERRRRRAKFLRLQRRRKETILRQQIGQRTANEAAASFPQKLAARPAAGSKRLLGESRLGFV